MVIFHSYVTNYQRVTIGFSIFGAKTPLVATPRQIPRLVGNLEMSHSNQPMDPILAPQDSHHKMNKHDIQHFDVYPTKASGSYHGYNSHVYVYIYVQYCIHVYVYIYTILYIIYIYTISYVYTTFIYIHVVHTQLLYIFMTYLYTFYVELWWIT